MNPTTLPRRPCPHCTRPVCLGHCPACTGWLLWDDEDPTVPGWSCLDCRRFYRKDGLRTAAEVYAKPIAPVPPETDEDREPEEAAHA